MLNELLPSLVSGVVCGLIAWGGIKVELRWLRRDVDHALLRIAQLERRNTGREVAPSYPDM